MPGKKSRLKHRDRGLSLVPIEGSDRMVPGFRAHRLLKDGAAIMVNGALRFTKIEPKYPVEQIEKIRQWGNSRRRPSNPLPKSPREIDRPKYLHWKESILLRDGYACVFCGSAKRLEIDHIKPWSIYPDLRYDIENGRTLCHECHTKTPTYGSKVRGIIAVTAESLLTDE